MTLLSRNQLEVGQKITFRLGREMCLTYTIGVELPRPSHTLYRYDVISTEIVLLDKRSAL